MLCLVRQANAVILEIEVDYKAKGQECLDKVCQMLGIIEVDYFGLQYAGQHGEMLWLNMRNPIKQQLTGTSPYRFQLRVKFFVPPHLLLQDVTRHQFYINVLQDFQDGKLRITDKNLAVKLTALIAQAEMGDLESDMISSALLLYPKWMPLSIFELHQPNLSSPVLNSRSGKRRKHDSGASEPEIESDEMTTSTSTNDFETSWTSLRPEHIVNSEEIANLAQMVLQQHLKLEGTRPNHAKYLFLQEIANIEDFGVEYFYVKSNTSSEEAFRIGVGPKGVTITKEETHEQVHSMPYSSIHMATHSGRCFFLTYIENNGETQALGFRLESGLAANAIYRSVTEKHAFYSCETVRNAVTSQFIRDLKGTIVSLFNENTALGKNYVFDIRRTCREVYDHTRRVIYNLENKSDETNHEFNNDSNIICFDIHNLHDKTDCSKLHCKDVKDRLETLQDSMLCRICMDVDVCTAFFPCGHVVCCEKCASLCDKCPLCRTQVGSTQRIYLPLTGKALHNLTCDESTKS